MDGIHIKQIVNYNINYLKNIMNQMHQKHIFVKLKAVQLGAGGVYNYHLPIGHLAFSRLVFNFIKQPHFLHV